MVGGAGAMPQPVRVPQAQGGGGDESDGEAAENDHGDSDDNDAAGMVIDDE